MHPETAGTIRIFISSTFKDLEAEREHLRTHVFPRLRAEAARRGATLATVDLSWGITRQQSRSGKVLEICLREIENSRPFFIGIIGRRYGWRPSASELNKNATLHERYGWLADDIKQGLSITEMEMQYGALRNPDLLAASFYIKEYTRGRHTLADTLRGACSLVSASGKRLKRLKTAVRDNGRYPVRAFADPDELGRLVEADFMAMLDRRFPHTELSQLSATRLAQRAFARDRCDIYIDVAANSAMLDRWLDSSSGALVVTSAPGMGKSALIATRLARGKERAGRRICYFIGHGGLEGDHKAIAMHLCREICDLYGFDGAQHQHDACEQLAVLCARIPAHEPLLIVLDGMDSLDASPQARSLDWLPVPSDRVRFVFTAHDGSPVLKTLDRRGCERAKLHPLGLEQRLQLVHEVLKKAYGKSIEPDLALRIAGDDESANTLVLRSLLDELAAHGRNTTLAARVNHYLKAKTCDQFFGLVLARFENDFGRDTTERLLAPLAFSRSGLQEDELLAISGLTQLQWSQFYCAFMPYLTRCRGLLDFSNRYVRDAARTRYAASEADSRRHIAALFAGRSDARACHELPWQLHATANHRALYAFLLDFEVLAQLCDTDEVQLARYWRLLTAHDKESFSPAAYLEMPCADSAAHIRLLGFLGHMAADHLTDGPLARRFHDKALTMAINLYGADSIEAAAAHNNKGCTLHSLGESDLALEHHLRALRIYESAEQDHYADTAATHNNIGLASAGKEEYSRRHFEKALALLDGKRGHSYFTATVCNNLANALRDEGVHDRAIQLYERALAELERAKGPDHPDSAAIKNNIGCLYSTAGDTATAMETHLEALRIYKATYGDGHPDVAVTLSRLGALCRQAGQSDEALRYLHEALRIFIATCGERHPETARCCHNLGVTYAEAGRAAEAMQFLSKAFDMR